MKSMRLIIGTFAVVFGLHSVATWAAKDPAKPNEKPSSEKSDKDKDPRKTPEPTCVF